MKYLRKLMAVAVMSLTAQVPLPPKTPKQPPQWVWKWWRDQVLAVKKELGLKRASPQVIVGREPYHNCIHRQWCDDCCWSKVGYEWLTIACEMS
jgi:hypothetical protein